MNKNLTSLKLTRIMGNGTNLGNTMEAYGHKNLGHTGKVIEYETAWGMPVTKKEMFPAYVKAGFNSIRIPVSWTNMMNYEQEDYTIDEAYLKRVEEIVGFALEAGMFVVLNDHWDGGWWSWFGSKDQSRRKKAMDLYTAIWTQVGNHFKNHPYELILEAANEELGRALRTEDSGDITDDEMYEITNMVNQTFVNLIRAQGENNKDRFLLVSGFNTDFKDTCDERFKMPKDLVEDKLLLSVHYYTPWDYCGLTNIPRWGTKKDLQEQNNLFEMMTKFTKQGYGIILGEFGVALEEDGTIKQDARLFMKNVLDNCDLYGFVPMLWDTNHYFKREELKINDSDISKLYETYSYEREKTISEVFVKEMATMSLKKTLDAAKS